jgi:Lipocalin-like domain
MAVQLMRTDRPAFTSSDVFQGTPEEIKAAYEGFAAYFGTYTVDDAAGTVTHHLQGHTFPNRIGSNNTRVFTFADQYLTLRASLRRNGRPLTALLIWARVA